MSDSTRLRTYDGTVEPDAHKFARQQDELGEQSGPCSDAAAQIAESLTDLPLDETALRVAQEKASAEYADDAYDRELISTYLREAGFEMQIDDASKHGYDGPKTHRQVGPWVPVVQAESEEE